MRLLVFISAILFVSVSVNAQKYMTRTGYISFFSTTPLEDIKAENNQVASVLDISNGEIVFQVLIKSFRFEKALMQEHFNENYLESDKFPRSEFKGKISDLSSVDFKKDGTYNITVSGDLTIKGVTKKIETKGTIEVASDNITANSVFSIVPEEYDIEIPGVVRDNIAKTIEVTVTMKYAPVEGK
jgi:polyisoprenoid-binding protein YceI